MARKVVLIDDVSGDTIQEGLGGTIKFSVDGTNYSIDLGVKNSDAFHKDLKKWIEAATEEEAAPSAPRRGRPAATTTSTRAPSGSGLSKEELANVREWAGKNGHEVAPRGRIKQEIIDAYMEAHAAPSKAD